VHSAFSRGVVQTYCVFWYVWNICPKVFGNKNARETLNFLIESVAVWNYRHLGTSACLLALFFTLGVNSVLEWKWCVLQKYKWNATIAEIQNVTIAVVKSREILRLSPLMSMSSPVLTDIRDVHLYPANWVVSGQANLSHFILEPPIELCNATLPSKRLIKVAYFIHGNPSKCIQWCIKNTNCYTALSKFPLLVVLP